jgi:DNA-binding NarL/FixJ family response regulator
MSRELACSTAAGHDVAGASGLGAWSVVPPTVLIVDDHDGFRDAASSLLESEGYSVVGTAANGRLALSESARLQPDIVLLDIQLPDLDGFAVADRLATGPDPPAVVLISSYDAATYGARLGRAPARGFLAKRDLSGAALAALVG